jgi:hypothetical protein
MSVYLNMHKFSWLKMYYALLESRVFYGYIVLHEENNSKDESDTS